MPKSVSLKTVFVLFILFPFLFMGLSSCRKSSESHEFEIRLDSGWHLQSSEVVQDPGSVISEAGYEEQDWHPTSVPGTVLAALIENGVYTDPFFGKNLERIPTDPFALSWWYRTEFILKNDWPEAVTRLRLEGINYSAEVWLNGGKVADRDTVRGAFRIFDLDISELLVAGVNALAVNVFPPEPGDFTIGFVDWNPKPPDGNMGLWRGVTLQRSGPVSLDSPFVRSRVDLDTLDRADLTLSTRLVNNSGQTVTGRIEAEIEDILISRPFSLEARETKEIEFRPEEFPELILNSPRLWWPHTFGEPNLYNLKMRVFTDDSLSDIHGTRFGIRQVDDYINSEGHRGYSINGKEILIRGGGWVDDLFLVEDRDKIEAQIKYARHMNLNTLRLEGFWGSSQTLYDLADQDGILLMAGWSCQWEWEDYLGKPVDEFGGIKTPEDMELIAQSLRDQVLWLRHHPSIFVWVLGSDMLPRPELERKYIAHLDRIDPTRPALAACGLLESEVSGPTAVKMNGPYDYVTPNYWSVDRTRGGAFGFNTETGPGPQPPPLESLKRMLPEDHLWPIDDFWEYHCGRNEFNTLDRYVLALDNRYGPSESVEEFARVAQAANYEAIRAMFEAFRANRPIATGIIQWMYNSAWPEMFWQLFDYYLMPNGAFYGTRTAGSPLQLTYNYGDGSLAVVNDTLSSFRDLKAEVRVFDADSRLRHEESLPVSIGVNESLKIGDLPPIDNLGTLYFLDLKLRNPEGEILSRNFYWLSSKKDVLDEANSTWFYTPSREYADFTALKSLPKARLESTHAFSDLGDDREVQVSLTNTSDKIAFFIEMTVTVAESGLSVLPIFWEDNYISLLPGETREIRAVFPIRALKGETAQFGLSGWNLDRDE